MKPSKNKKKSNQKELASLFGEKIKSESQPKPLKRWVDKRTQGLEKPEAVVVKDLAELHAIVDHLKSDDKTNDPEALPITVTSRGTHFEDENFRGNITIPQSGGDPMTRKTLLEGFDMLKRRQETMLSLKTDGDSFGEFKPAALVDPTTHITWVDRFIEDRLGGKRVGLSIIWEIPEGKYKLDPWTCILERIDD